MDPDAEMPEDWDEEEDGEWERPEIKNPDYKGEWKQKMMDNPEYKGKWEAPMIKNPEYVDGSGDELYRYTDLKYVGFELWQVKVGSLFDNILVNRGDSGWATLLLLFELFLYLSCCRSASQLRFQRPLCFLYYALIDFDPSERFAAIVLLLILVLGDG